MQKQLVRGLSQGLGWCIQIIKRILGLGIYRWHLVLIVMLIFAINRYAVASLSKEKRSLQSRFDLLVQESDRLKSKIDILSSQIKSFHDPRWQEMVIMRNLLLFPEESEVYWHNSGGLEQESGSLAP